MPTLLVLEYTVHPGDIVIKITGSEDRVVRVNNEVNVLIVKQN